MDDLIGDEIMGTNCGYSRFKVTRRIIRSLNNRGILNWLPDRLCIQLIYWAQLGRSVDLKHPETFNEKIQWLKLYDRKPEYQRLADKYAVREYVASKIGDKYLIPCYGVWDSPWDIDFEKLPEQYVLKCTHDQGSIRICKDAETFDREESKRYLAKRCKRNAFYYGREWPYKVIKPRVIAEGYLIDQKESDLFDYKVHCFSGVPKVILVCSERSQGLKEDWFDTEWNHLPVHRPTHKNSGKVIKRPEKLEEMLRCAEVLSEGKIFSRIDFYYVNGRIYFGEITFYPTSGYTDFVPEEYDLILGRYINLGDVKV